MLENYYNNVRYVADEASFALIQSNMVKERLVQCVVNSTMHKLYEQEILQSTVVPTN